MEREQRLRGKELEQWFIQFAKKEKLEFIPPVTLKNLVIKLNSELPKRFNDCRDYLDLDCPNPNANQWIDRILLSKEEPNITRQEKQDLINYLLDSVVASDAIIEISNTQGEPVRIAIDLTANPGKADKKVQKVKGLPDQRDRPGDNKNRNIPKIRRWLGIDKHLVLVLNNQESLLPSREKLLAELQAFAECTSITGAVNLKQLARSETLAGAAQQEKKRAFQSFLSGYLDAAVRSVIASLEKTELKTTQPDGSVTNGPAIVLREDGSKSFESGSFSWNLMPDNSVSITRLKDRSQITPESATPREMDAIKEFVVECHKKFLKNQQEQDNDDVPQSQKQKPRQPRL